MENTKDIVKLEKGKLDINDIFQSVVSPNSGAISTFVGTTRDSFKNKKVLQLEYEAYEPMALKEMHNLCGKIRAQWSVQHIAICHRLGNVPVSEASVAIAISSPHRQESLQAVQFAIDTLKASVPIWKKEVYKDDTAEWKENKEYPAKAENKEDDSTKTLVPKMERIEDERWDYEINPDQLQIKASTDELNSRIDKFISQKRQRVSYANIQEFCCKQDQSEESQDSCARVDAILSRHKDSKCHFKVHTVLNSRGPQTMDAAALYKSENSSPTGNYSSALEERLSVAEISIGINKPVPKDVYQRLRNIEDRVLYLEGISPEYKTFSMKNDDGDVDNSKPIRKRTFSMAELDNKLHALEDRYVQRLK